MIFFLTSHSLWLSGFIIIGLGTLLATLGPSVVRHFVALDKLVTNNEIAGFKFATVGVLYAVLLAFTIIVVWQKYADAETTVAQEAGAAASIFQLSYGIDEKPGTALRHALSNYLAQALTNVLFSTLSRIQHDLGRLKRGYFSVLSLGGLMLFPVCAGIAVAALSIPGATVLTLAAGAIFGLLAGTIIVSFASSLGATLAFLSARFVLRDSVQSRFGARLADIDADILAHRRDGHCRCHTSLSFL